MMVVHDFFRDLVVFDRSQYFINFFVWDPDAMEFSQKHTISALMSSFELRQYDDCKIGHWSFDHHPGSDYLLDLNIYLHSLDGFVGGDDE